MSELRRPWFTLTKTGSVLPPVFEIVLGVLGLGAAALSAHAARTATTTPEPDDAVTVPGDGSTTA